MATLLIPISSRCHSPTYSAFSANRKDNLGSCKLNVWHALMMCARTLNVFSSVINPEGTSIDTTVAGDELMYFTTAAKPPLKGLLRPEPKSPSITKWLAVSVGGTNCVLTSVKVTECMDSIRSRLTWQSADNNPLVLNK